MMKHNKDIDNLKIQVQYLQEKLERFNSLKILFKRLIRVVFVDTFKKVTKFNHRFLHQYDSNYSKSSFKPYLLDYKHNREVGRPVVFHLISNFKTGGASRIIVDIAEHLSKEFEHIVITRYNPIPQNYEGIQVIELCSIPTQKEVQQLFILHAPVIVHTHWSTRWSEEDSLWQWYYSFYKYIEIHQIPIIQNVNVPVVPFLFKRTKSINAFVSRFVLENFSFQNQDNRVVYPGSDFDFFSINNRFNYSSKVVGMVYRLDDHKLQKDSIEPFIQAVLKDTEITVLIIGDGELKSHFKKRVKEAFVADNFTFVGYVPYQDLPKWYAQFSLFVAPVYEESFGQVTPFAMSMGVAVIGYNTGAILEIIQDASCVVETGNVGLLANLIVNKVNDKAFLSEKNIKNKELVLRFSLNFMIESFEEIYKELLIFDQL